MLPLHGMASALENYTSWGYLYKPAQNKPRENSCKDGEDAFQAPVITEEPTAANNFWEDKSFFQRMQTGRILMHQWKANTHAHIDNTKWTQEDTKLGGGYIGNDIGRTRRGNGKQLQSQFVIYVYEISKNKEKLSIIKTYTEAHLFNDKLHSLTMSNPPL